MLCIRMNHSYQDIISVKNLCEGWSEFKRGKKSKKDVAEFALNLSQNIFTLHNELKNKTYRHGTYQHFVVNDPKRRDIYKASVRDRVVHHALYRVLYPYFDQRFIHDSYSCRNNKGTHRALRQFERFSKKVSQNYTKQCWVLNNVLNLYQNLNETRKAKEINPLGLFGTSIASFVYNM